MTLEFYLAASVSGDFSKEAVCFSQSLGMQSPRLGKLLQDGVV